MRSISALEGFGGQLRVDVQVPSAAPDRDESIEDGLRREAREETGLTVEPVALTGVYKNMSRSIVALVFRCKVAGGQLTANDEVTAFQWADDERFAGCSPTPTPSG